MIKKHSKRLKKDIYINEKERFILLKIRILISPNKLIVKKKIKSWKTKEFKIINCIFQEKKIINNIKSSFCKQINQAKSIFLLRYNVLNIIDKTNQIFCQLKKKIKIANYRLFKLPGPFPKTLNPYHLNIMNQNPNYYFVCEKTDGERHMFYIKTSEPRNVFFINRKFEFLRINIDNKFYNFLVDMIGDTLIDGEIIICNGILFFFIFDAIQIDGINIRDNNLLERINHVHLFVKVFHNMVNLGIRFKQKMFYSVERVKEMISRIKRKNGKYYYDGTKEKQPTRKNDGLIFTFMNENYLMNKNNKHVLKWKWMDKNTIDLRVKKPFFDNNGSLRLFAGGKKNKDILFRRTILTFKQKELFEKLKGQVLGFNANTEDFIVECRFSSETRTWIPFNIRPDKNLPNFITTVTSMFSVLIDSLVCNELINNLKKSK